VELNPDAIVEDVVVERFVNVVDSEGALAEWRSGKHIRLMFVSRHNRSLGIRWSSPKNGEIDKKKHWHPHMGSKFDFWWTSDVAAALPCYPCYAQDMKRYEGYAKLGDANSGINPTFWPILTIWPQLFSVINLELFIPMEASILGSNRWLFKLIQSLQNFHYEHGGRTELRIAKDDTILYLDISLRSLKSMTEYFTTLKKEHAIERAAQHAGKYVMSGIRPLKEISVASVFRPLSTVRFV